MKRITRLGAALLLAALGQAAVAQETASGELLGQNCAACHGTDGREFNEAMPALAGMDKGQFIRAMQSFRDGSRQAVVMDRIAKAFSDREIEIMAEYFAAQTPRQYGEDER